MTAQHNTNEKGKTVLWTRVMKKHFKERTTVLWVFSSSASTVHLLYLFCRDFIHIKTSVPHIHQSTVQVTKHQLLPHTNCHSNTIEKICLKAFLQKPFRIPLHDKCYLDITTDKRVCPTYYIRGVICGFLSLCTQAVVDKYQLKYSVSHIWFLATVRFKLNWKSKQCPGNSNTNYSMGITAIFKAP